MRLAEQTPGPSQPAALSRRPRLVELGAHPGFPAQMSLKALEQESHFPFGAFTRSPSKQADAVPCPQVEPIPSKLSVVTAIFKSGELPFFYFNKLSPHDLK